MFHITVTERVFERLKRLEKFEFFGRDLEDMAECAVYSWFNRHKAHMKAKYELDFEDAKQRGYVQLIPARSRRTFYAHDDPNIKVRLIGLARYFFEMLPRIEHSKKGNNPFYQKNTDFIFNFILDRELARYEVKARRIFQAF